jgi:hypothetical protein
VRQVLARLFSTKTLARVAFTTLSLHFMSSAFGQGLPAGTMAPVYCTSWPPAQAPSHSLNTQTMTSEAAKPIRINAPLTSDRNACLPFRRTGG